jgi:HJR/Mrr/RecB family endonuclease
MTKKITAKANSAKKYSYKRSYFTYEGKAYNITGRTQKEADQKASLVAEALKRGEIGVRRFRASIRERRNQTQYHRLRTQADT